MSLTPAEKQRAYRERQKERKRQELKQAAPAQSVFRKPFFEVMEDYQGEFDVALGLAGIEAPYFDNDDPPERFVLGHVTDLDDPFSRLETASGQGSLPRAEILIGLLIEGARIMSNAVHDYKQDEIKARLAEIEGSDLSDPDKKKAALKEATRLNKMMDQLDKQVRITFPQWKVTG